MTIDLDDLLDPMELAKAIVVAVDENKTLEEIAIAIDGYTRRRIKEAFNSPMVMTVASGKLSDKAVAGIKKFMDEIDSGRLKSVIFSGPDPVYVLMADLDGTVRSSADCPVGWTIDKARALQHLVEAEGGYGHAVIICDEGKHGMPFNEKNTNATRFARLEDLTDDVDEAKAEMKRLKLSRAKERRFK